MCWSGTETAISLKDACILLLYGFLKSSGNYQHTWKSMLNDISSVIAGRRLTRKRYINYGFSKPLGHISVASLIIGNYFIQRKVEVLVPQSYPTLCDPLDCSPPGSSVHGFLKARILEWIAIPFSRESSRLRDGTQVSCIAARFFTVWATSETIFFKGDP